MTFLHHGSSETFKGIWHLGGLIFAGGALVYNVAAMLQRREPHLLANTVIYGMLTIYESQKVAHHFEDANAASL